VQRTYDLMRRKPAADDVDWLGSGNMAVRRAVFEQVGRFDIGLHTCEDVDLCRRVRQAGYRILHDARLKNVHFGDPATLRGLFRGELWRGRDNLRVSLRGPLTVRELPSVLVPVATVLLLTTAVIAALVGGSLGWLVSAAAVGGVLAASVLRTARMLRQARRVTAVSAAQAYAVALTYDLARALALIKPGHHEARRAAS
jgi:hypothetical protein